MPALVAPLLGLALGALLAWLRRRELTRFAPREARQAFGLVLAYALLLLTPAAAFLLVVARDWSLGFLVDGARVPSALYLVLLMVDAGSFPLGYFTAARAIRRGAPRVALGLAGVAAALAVVVLVPGGSALRFDASYQQLQQRFGTRPVFGGPLGFTLGWLSAGLVVGWALLGDALRRSARS